MLKSDLCDYSDAYIVVKGIIVLHECKQCNNNVSSVTGTIANRNK